MADDNGREYFIRTKDMGDGTFRAKAYAIHNGTMRQVASDQADGFTSRYQAAKWAKKCRSAQMRNDCSLSR